MATSQTGRRAIGCCWICNGGPLSLRLEVYKKVKSGPIFPCAAESRVILTNVCNACEGFGLEIWRKSRPILFIQGILHSAPGIEISRSSTLSLHPSLTPYKIFGYAMMTVASLLAPDPLPNALACQDFPFAPLAEYEIQGEISSDR